MKIQDGLFFIIFILLVLLKKPQWFTFAGLFCLFLSIPLFVSWVFFTAQRLTWYAVALLLTSVIYAYYRKDIV